MQKWYDLCSVDLEIAAVAPRASQQFVEADAVVSDPQLQVSGTSKHRLKRMTCYFMKQTVR